MPSQDRALSSDGETVPSGCGVAILAGGQSRRMGSPKHLVHLPDGRTMAEHMCALARQISDVVCMIGARCDHCPSLPDGAQYTGMGPLAGIEAALASELAHHWMVLPCDMPLLSVATLRVMRDHPHDGAITLDGAGPLPVRLPASCLREVRDALQSEHLALRHLPSIQEAIAIGVHDTQELCDVDDTDALAGLSEALAKLKPSQ